MAKVWERASGKLVVNSGGTDRALLNLADDLYARKMQKFFKLGPGEYGDGDIFIGVRNPDLRLLAKQNSHLSLKEVGALMRSEVHEERLLALLIVMEKYGKQERRGRAGLGERKRLYRFYCQFFSSINNWDLVDVSCPHVVGKFLLEHPQEKDILLQWAGSPHLWTRRIAVVSNGWLIRRGDLSMIFQVASLLLEDSEDLIHKAVGWMLREAGKRDFEKADHFISNYGGVMPRVMLRYAIERYPEELRREYLTR